MRFDQVKFGHRIKHLRKKRNLTQEQLATALHISTDHLSIIELGKRGISIDLLLDISAALHGCEPHRKAARFRLSPNFRVMEYRGFVNTHTCDSFRSYSTCLRGQRTDTVYRRTESY